MNDPAQKMSALTEDGLWVVADVARFLKMSVSWVRKRTARGEIPLLRIGSAIRFEPEKIKAWARTGCGGKVVDFKR